MFGNCKFCGKECHNKYSLKAHEFRCKQNPDYLENTKKYSVTTEKFAFRARNRPSAYFDLTLNCMKCGKEFTQRTTQALINRNKHKRCCSSKCAHSRIKTPETKNKISLGLNKFLASIGKNRKISKVSKNIGCNVSKNPRYYSSKEINDLKCVFCGKEIRCKYTAFAYCYECAEKNNLPNLLLWDKNNKTIPSKKKIESGRKIQERLLKENRHKGWQTRSVISYPEQFWIDVLINNKIKFSFNHTVNKKELGLTEISNYFLDFLIGGKLDLEIDGKQHKYKDRLLSDKKRDKILSENGYLVYRIEWNEINSEKGKKLMKEKVDKFLDYYKTIFPEQT